MPGNRLAQFTVSYYTNQIDSLVIAGTKGSIQMSPAFGFGPDLEHQRKIGDDQLHETFKAVDQFGGELKYFSECVIEHRSVEPDGEEGLAGLLVVEAIVEALRSGGSVKEEPLARTRRIDPEEQEQRLRPVAIPKPVNSTKPTRS